MYVLSEYQIIPITGVVTFIIPIYEFILYIITLRLYFVAIL